LQRPPSSSDETPLGILEAGHGGPLSFRPFSSGMASTTGEQQDRSGRLSEEIARLPQILPWPRRSSRVDHSARPDSTRW